ncbi:MAG: acetylornithine deacetylase [Candidatus Bathyarchaeota archaeon B26-2]|nr:MAG: acetylornithine deacetylase [Candidatus Bathyarchaeota archaeon B26-2]
MEPEYPVKLLERVLKVYSPSGHERELAGLLKDEMESLGFRNVRLDKVGNVYGEVGGGSPTVMLCGHMDTVPGWIPVRFEGGRLHGRGAVDAKSSLAAMIVAASLLDLDGFSGKVITVGVVEEERRSRGIRQLIHEGLKVDYAVFGEPSGVRNITFAYRGRLKFEVTCRTETGHVGAQHVHRNAAEEAYTVWSRLKSTFEAKASPHGVFYSPTPVLVGIRSGGEGYGVVPDTCTVDVDLRLPPTLHCDEALEIVEESIEKYRRGNPEVLVELRVLDRVEPYVADRGSPLITALKESIKEVLGVPARLLRKTGTGDMNIFGASLGVPVATYGPGDSKLSHTKDEYIEVEEYLTSINVYKIALKRLLTLL